MKKIIVTLLLCLTLVGCNAGAGSDTHEPAYEPTILYTIPDSGVFEDDTSVKISFQYEDSLAIERTYVYKDGAFEKLIINIYPCAKFQYEDIASVTTCSNFEENSGYYTATVTDGFEVASVHSMSKDEVYDSLLLQYANLTST